jgi:hypothetical protein
MKKSKKFLSRKKNDFFKLIHLEKNKTTSEDMKLKSLEVKIQRFKLFEKIVELGIKLLLF